jgi:RimJ/RimL family protein N-acetyltransferase
MFWLIYFVLKEKISHLVKSNDFRYEGFSPRYLKINNEWRGHEHWAITVEDYIADSPAVLKKDHVNLVPSKD